MFATLRRHQKWFWAAIIAVVIPSFVIFFTPDANMGFGGGGNFGTISGRAISQEEYANGYREAELRHLFSYGEWPGRDTSRQGGFDVDREARNRVLMVRKLKEYGVHVSDDAVGKWIANAFRDRRQNTFRMDSYEQFVRKTLAEHGIRERDFERFVRNEVAIQQMIAVFGLPGRLVTPREAEAQYRQENEQNETEAVVFSMTNYLANVSITPSALSQFYSNRLVNYRIPERVQVRYIRFNVTNYLAEAAQRVSKETNLTQILNSIYQQQGPNYFTGADGKPLPEAEAKEKIKERLAHDFALQIARRNAGSFAVTLDKMGPQKLANFNTLAASSNLTMTVTEPFSESDGPRGLAVMDNFARVAFALTADEPMAPPLNGEDGIYVIGLEKRIPSELPALEVIKDRVTDEYRRSQAMSLARAEGDKFHEKLTNSLAQGKTFEAACKDAKVTAIKLPKFARSTRSLDDLDERLDLSHLKELAAELTPGKASRLTYTRDGGFVLYLANRLPVDDAVMKKELPDFMKNMRQSQMYESFAAWVNQQIALAKITEPGGKKTTAEK